MSRAIIAGSVAIAILVLTGASYLVATSRLENRIKRDVKVRVDKAQELLVQNSSLEALKLLRRVEALATDRRLLRALKEPDPAARASLADEAFQKFRASRGEGERTEILALLSAEGDLVVLQLRDKDTPITNPGAWKEGGELKYPAIKLALNPDPEKAEVVADIWDHQGQGLIKAGVAPIVDPEVNDVVGAEANEVIGAVLVAYSLGAREARSQSRLLGADVAYFRNQRIYATSFRREESGEEDTAMQERLVGPLVEKGLGQKALDQGLADAIDVTIDGEEYYAAAGRIRGFASKGTAIPASVGAMVMISLDDAMSSLGTVKIAILLLGLGALVISLLALTLTSKRIIHQADEIELGINDVTNGNLEMTFRHVGSELDGLANALNVMLARLLGRPEPGDEEYDENGNVIQSSKLSFDPNLSQSDSEAVALAQEPEPDYYKRLYGEYIEARKSVGESVEGVSFDSFVTKLRVNEANLKGKYQCSAIRFKVVVKNNGVTLKPVPIV